MIKYSKISIDALRKESVEFFLNVSEVWINTSTQSPGQQGQSTLLAGTTSAPSDTRRGPDHNRPTRRAFFENWH